ncbi:hypothetical protein [Corynebacterium sp. MNWGS58]|uniref:hypothetical protein n=1 Tax=Corynebacterium sp. 102791.4 TaxID=3104612 RepID=UPI0035128B5E
MNSAASFRRFSSRRTTSGRTDSRRLAATALLTASALMLAACGDDGASDAGDSAAGSAGDRRGTPPATENAVGLPIDAPRIEVASTGEGERAVLAYDDVDAEQAVDIEVTEGFEQFVVRNEQLVTAAPDTGAGADTTQGPGADDSVTTTLPVAGSVLVPEGFEDSTPGADAARHVDFRVRDPQISDTGLAEQIASADGFGFGWLAEPNGQLATLLLAAPQQAGDEARAIVEQSITKLVSAPVIFPEEAVGVGARWSVDSRVTGESTMLQTTTFEITELADDTVELDISIEQRPALGALSLEGLAGAEGFADDTLNVTSSNTRSHGSLTVDLRKPLPVAGELDYTTRVVYGTDGSDASVVQDSSTRLRFTTAQ